MVKIQVLALLAIVFCFTFQSQASPLALREETDREETDREFEDAFEAALNEEEARQFENVNEARNFEDDDDEEARSLQEVAEMETDREFEDAFAAAIQEEVARNFKNFETEEEMNLSEDGQSEDKRQISADFDITPPKENEVRQVPAPEVPAPEVPAPEVPAAVVPAAVVPAPEIPAPSPDVKPRTTQPLRLSQLIVRPVLIKRCQGATNYSVGHCAKYLSCGAKMFRGAIRTCESGQLFDAVLKKCNDAEKVDCKIRT